MTDYPVSEKLAGLQDERDTLVELFEWLGTKGYIVGEYAYVEGYSDQHLLPSRKNVDDLIMEHLGIDTVALEKERRAMLASL